MSAGGSAGAAGCSGTTSGVGATTTSSSTAGALGAGSAAGAGSSTAGAGAGVGCGAGASATGSALRVLRDLMRFIFEGMTNRTSNVAMMQMIAQTMQMMTGVFLFFRFINRKIVEIGIFFKGRILFECRVFEVVGESCWNRSWLVKIRYGII